MFGDHRLAIELQLESTSMYVSGVEVGVGVAVEVGNWTRIAQ